MPSSEDFIGSIDLWSIPWAPRGWALCNGQILQIQQNQALYALIYNTYGGNGTSTFALPDMRGRVPVGMGQGTGLPSFSLGKADGEVTHTLTINEIPLHNHVVVCNDTASGRDLLETPNGNIMAKSSSDSCHYAASSNGVMAGTMINTAGASQPHQNMQPYTVINYIIAIEGVWPSRE